MIEVVSVKFKNRGKNYFFDPRDLKVEAGQKVIVETSKGLEIVDCCHGNHMVMDTAVIQPLRPVVRIATADDLRIAELNKRREKEAFQICQEKIAQHGLDMRLVDVECNFEGNKTMFFFTSDGRVDFRELVKDLAGIFRNRIELRQIGVRDEAKMIGGIGICGRPYCCNTFLEEFQPVSTKMAKIQSLSLNPAKISGSCGRLMCCLRYEQPAYEELVKKVPKQGAFVETKDGYGTAVQVNLLRQCVTVRLDKEDELRVFKANELCAVPGGRPKDGEAPPHVLNYVPEPEEELEPETDPWAIPTMVAPSVPVSPVQEKRPQERKNSERRRGPRKPKSQKPAEQKQGDKQDKNKERDAKPAQPREKRQNPKEQNQGKEQKPRKDRPRRDQQPKVVKVEAKPAGENAAQPKEGEKGQRRPNRRRRYYNNRPKDQSPKQG